MEFVVLVHVMHARNFFRPKVVSELLTENLGVTKIDELLEV